MSAPATDVAVGDVLSIRATKRVQQGFCLGHLESGLPVFIHGALPEEELRVRISRVRQGHAFAVVEEVVTAAADRQASDCSAFPYCGGCSFRQISYDAEFELKLQLLGELPHLQHAIDAAKSANRFRTHRGEPDGYRIRARLHQATQTSRPGFYALHSNAIVPFPESPGCRQLADELNEHFAGTAFLDIIAQDEEARLIDRHWRPQHLEICYGQVRYDLIGRVEDMQAARAQIVETLFGPRGHKVTILDTRKHLGHTSSSRADREALTAQDRRNVERAFARDFDMYERVASAPVA